MVMGKVRPVNIEDEMRGSYLDYAMSVIVARALPDLRDGLKPVQRRILHSMNDMGLAPPSPYRKSARIVGEVMGKYHPHGDIPVYDAMVRMAQVFSLRYPLVDGQGNFGSVDNDPPAAMRYTEARLSKIATEMLVDIEKGTVDMMPNFDDSLKEPTVLPARLPNLLINGSSGIAVGMATNIPPHNLGEVCDAIAYLIDNPEATVEELTRLVRGPDFPTAGIILGQEGIKSAYATGHGRVVVRGKAGIQEAPGGQQQIVITELPYETNKAALIERIAELVKEKRIGGVSALRDESDRQGMRVVIELRRDTQPLQVLNSLYKFTALQSTFFVNMLALVAGEPRVIGLKEALKGYIDFRTEVITRRTRFDLKVAKDRAHILEGLKIALDHIEEVINLIRRSASVEAARQALMEKFSLSQIQAQAILDMPLRRLASLERKKILDEYTEVIKSIAYFEDLLANPRKILNLIKEDVAGLKDRYGDSRRTQIMEEEAREFTEVDLIPHEQEVVTLSHRGFVKRVPADKYRIQHRGGKGIIGMEFVEEDATRLLTVADTHDNLLFFTNRGKVYAIKCYELYSDVSRTAKGMAIINLFPAMAEDEKVTAMVALTGFKPDDFLVMATRLGEVKKTAGDNFAVVRSNGLIAMDLAPEDELVSVCLATDDNDVMMVTERGQAVRFAVKTLRSSSRMSGGVRGMRLREGDRVVSMDTAPDDRFVLIVTVNGYGKLTRVSEYPHHRRGGSGVKTLRVTEKTGVVAAARVVSFTDQVMIISAEGIIMATPVREKGGERGIRITSRVAQGVILMRMKKEGDKVSTIAVFTGEEGEQAALPGLAG
ncbi:MAG: DNA gyrase subunit A [Chloroflexota bacterium]